MYYLIYSILFSILILFLALHVYYLILLARLLRATNFNYPWLVWLTIIPFAGNFLWIYLAFKAWKGTKLTLQQQASTVHSNAGFYSFIIFLFFCVTTISLENHPNALTVCSLTAAIFYITHVFQVYKTNKLIISTLQSNS